MSRFLESADRFWSKVNKTDGCWEWTACCFDNGYGVFRHQYKNHKAHRVAFELTHGPIPEGKVVCHSCDNHKCVNPSHLWLGTNAENSADMKRKLRQAWGNRASKSRLLPEHVREIRRLHSDGMGQYRLAERFGVSQNAISRIVRYLSWRHLAAACLLVLPVQASAATTTANMSLSTPSVGDTDYATSVSDSFTLIDAHDHSTGKGVQIPAGGLANGAVTVNKIASSATDGSTIEVSSGALQVKDGGITAAKLASGLGIVPAGSVQYYLGGSAPSGYLLGQGQEVSRTTYADLFAVVGTAFGSGDGSTTFNLPDCRGMFIRGHVGYTSVTFGTSDVDTGTDVITVSGGHNLNRSGFPVRLTTSSSLPAGLSTSTTYYSIYVTSTTFKLASSEANALSGTAIDITTTGAGTQTMAQYIDIDASSRTAQSTGGNTGTSIGAKQDGAFSSHTHSNSLNDTGHGHGFRFDNSGGGALTQYLSVVAAVSAVYSTTASSSVETNTTGITITNASTGGNETRPQNLTMNCIVKY